MIDLIIKQNLQEISKENQYKFRCIDGRSPENKSNEILAHFPWSNVWHFISILSAIESFYTLNTENLNKIYLNYINFIWGETKFFFHTANEHLSEIILEWKPIIKTWCWHIKLLFNTDDYSVSFNIKNFVFDIIQKLPKENIEILDWWHQEKWVIIIKNCYNEKWNLITAPVYIDWISFFVFDKWHIFNVNKEFADYLSKNLPQFYNKDILEKFNNICDSHFNITWNVLAKNLPIYII